MKNQLPYSEADCIQAAVVNVIRHCEGGDPSYRCGGCTELWNSIDSSPKYKFITERLTIAEAKQRGLLIGDLPCIYDEATGKCEHIGYYMGGIGGYEVIHSSQTRQWVAATQLKNGFTHILRHRLIRGVSPSAVNDFIDKDESEMAVSERVVSGNIHGGGHLNLRLKPSTAGRVLDELENGSSVSVLEETNASWLKVSAGGRTGCFPSLHSEESRIC
ncbi:MAG: SH3 domain-containing protein [Christensenellales bacterium]